MPVYSNAADVLPPELLREVQKHWRGLLYVPPAADSPRKEDAEFTRTMIRSGCPASNVASVTGVTLGRVYQIARLLGTENPYQRRRTAEAATDAEKHTDEVECGSARPGPTSDPMVPPSEVKKDGRAEGGGITSRLACKG